MGTSEGVHEAAQSCLGVARDRLGTGWESIGNRLGINWESGAKTQGRCAASEVSLLLLASKSLGRVGFFNTHQAVVGLGVAALDLRVANRAALAEPQDAAGTGALPVGDV